MVIARGFHVELTPQTLRDLLYLMTTRLVFPLMAGELCWQAPSGDAPGRHAPRIRARQARSGFQAHQSGENLANLKTQNLTQFVQALICCLFFRSLCGPWPRTISLLSPASVSDHRFRPQARHRSIGDLLWKAASSS